MHSPIEIALRERRGVCQDFAHIMIAIARRWGIPARYVSGYLYHRERTQDRSSADATHAWVEAYLPSLGWIGFDPTNNILAGERHIRAAVGRDYADVPPTRGTFKGGATSELAISVAVEPTQAPVRHEDFLRVARPMAYAARDSLDAGAALPSAAATTAVAEGRPPQSRYLTASAESSAAMRGISVAPVAEFLRAEDVGLAIPGIFVGAELRPGAAGGQEPDFRADAAGSGRCCRGRRNHEIERSRQRRRAVDVVLQIDVHRTWMSTPQRLFDARDLGGAVAILQIDEGHARRLQDRRPQRRARCNIWRAWRRASSNASRCRHKGPGPSSSSVSRNAATRSGSGMRNASCGKSSTDLRRYCSAEPIGTQKSGSPLSVDELHEAQRLVAVRIDQGAVVIGADFGLGKGALEQRHQARIDGDLRACRSRRPRAEDRAGCWRT